MEQYEEVFLEIAALAMKANRVTNHHFFIKFSGHVNLIEVSYLENGYIEDARNNIKLLYLYMDNMLKDKILAELEKCKSTILALIEDNKKEPQEKVQ